MDNNRQDKLSLLSNRNYQNEIEINEIKKNIEIIAKWWIFEVFKDISTMKKDSEKTTNF
jgi:hypothetical protein